METKRRNGCHTRKQDSTVLYQAMSHIILMIYVSECSIQDIVACSYLF